MNIMNLVHFSGLIENVFRHISDNSNHNLNLNLTLTDNFHPNPNPNPEAQKLIRENEMTSYLGKCPDNEYNIDHKS